MHQRTGSDRKLKPADTPFNPTFVASSNGVNVSLHDSSQFSSGPGASTGRGI